MSGLRNTSGKFSLGSFGRKVSGLPDSPASPSRTNGLDNGDDFSPPRDGQGGGNGSGGVAFDGIGKKLGKSLAHQSFMPSLGNQDLRALQDVISTEKGVMQAAEKLGQETAKAAASFPPYGSQEGPDLQDVLTQSSNLLGQLANALATYTNHSGSIRSCFKRIREREEKLDELKRRRKSTGSKAEAAEKKLAKMGPENKGLPQQTELLERLRTEMRQMDSDIVVEDSKVGDFKRQMIKEAMSYKFGGLEELGEKMCIIGELGKLLIEEVPLEETPPGYGRAPYTGYDKTESAVNEANKCLSTVKFVSGSVGPKPPGLPPHDPIGPLQNSPDPSRIHAAEQFGHYPADANGDQHSSVDFKGKGRDFALDEANPYGGFDNPYDRATGRYPRYDDGGSVNESSAQGGQAVWQGPTEEALRAHTQQHEVDGRHDYEYAQQKQIDAENAAWRNGEPQMPTVQVATPETAPQIPPPDLGSPRLNNPVLEPEESYGGPSTLPPGAAAADHLQRPWEPLNVRRDRANSPAPVSLQDGPARTEASPRPRPISQDPLSGIGAMMTSTDMDDRDEPAPASNRPSIERDAPLQPPTLAGGSDTGSRTGFYTPTGGATPESTNEYFQAPSRGQMPVPGRVGSPSIPLPPSMPAAAPPRSTSPGPSHSQNPSISIPPAPINLLPASSYTPTAGGKISAAAFRRPKPQPRLSEGMDITSPISPTHSTGTPPAQNGNGGRKLPMPPGPGGMGSAPVPPGRPETPIEANFALPASPSQDPALAQRQRVSGSFADLVGDASPPPMYHDESMR